MTPCKGALVLAWLALAPACRAAEPCPPADDYGLPAEKLDHLAAAIRGGGPVDILAMGPAPAGADDAASLPGRMAKALRAALPGISVTLSRLGAPGLSAADAAPLLAAQLATHRASLVLWQTGTTEAVRGLRTDEFADALADGAAHASEAGADLILIDPQYSRFLRANADVEAYEEVMRDAAALPSVVLFRRFDLMHAWVDDGAIDVERATKAEREADVAHLHECLGEVLAGFVLAGASSSVPDADQDK